MDIINPYIHGGEAVAFDGFGNRSRSFDGVDDEVIVSDSPSFPTGAQTWSCWVKPSRLSFGASGQDIMSKWGSQGSSELSAILFLSNTGGGKPQFYISDNGSNVFLAASSSILTVNKWHHIVGVFTPSTSLKIYVDGVLTGTNTTNIPSAIKDTPADLKMGWRDLSFEAHFKGNICDCRIYDTDLTATDISDIYNGTNITTNLFGHWLKDADNVLDAAGTNHGTNYGSKYSYDNPSPPVEFGRASRSFDGVDDYVDLGNDASLDLTSTLTMSFWIKPDSAHDGAILSKWTSGASNVFTNAYTCYFGQDAGNRRLNIIVQQSNGTKITLSDSTDLPLSQWSHVACIADGSNLSIFIDGQSSSSISYDGTIDVDPVKLVIGRLRQTDSLYPFDGKIADVRIYDTDLTASQVSDLYAGTNLTTNLIGHWLTDNDDVEDKAGTNDGTNFGSVYSYEAPLPANKLIDTYASTCGAYSLRELTTNWAGQSVVDVRRASDNAVQAFTEAQISDGTLATFCGTQGGFVSKTYDQSGNGFDLIQPTSTYQPRIYTGTTQLVVTSNGKPALDFSSQAYMYNAGSFDYEGGVSWLCVLNTNILGTSGQRIWGDDIIGTQGYVNFSPTQYNLNDGAGYESFAVTGAATNQQIRSFYFNEATGNYVYGMNETETSASLSGFTGGTIERSGTSANIGVMGAGNGGQNLEGLWQELIVYPNDQLHNKENIERDVNEFYSIY